MGARHDKGQCSMGRKLLSGLNDKRKYLYRRNAIHFLSFCICGEQRRGNWCCQRSFRIVNRAIAILCDELIIMATVVGPEDGWLSGQAHQSTGAEEKRKGPSV